MNYGVIADYMKTQEYLGGKPDAKTINDRVNETIRKQEWFGLYIVWSCDDFINRLFKDRHDLVIGTTEYAVEARKINREHSMLFESKVYDMVKSGVFTNEEFTIFLSKRYRY